VKECIVLDFTDLTNKFEVFLEDFDDFTIDPKYLKTNLPPEEFETLHKLLSISEEKILEKVSKEDKYNLFESATSQVNFVLFPPVNGTISEGYNAKEKHFGVDIVVAKDTPIKAVSDGTVIFSEWTAETGYVIIIEHRHGLISVYKHNAELFKSAGLKVKAGDAIAVIGNSGELSSGPHLHFELWHNGVPLDPVKYIVF